MSALPTTGGFGWYLRRLQVMTPAEVLHRVKEQTGYAAAEVRSLVSREDCQSDVLVRPEAYAFCRSVDRHLPDLSWQFDPTEEEIEHCLAGRVWLHGAWWQWRPDSTLWHEAPDTKAPWPQSFFWRIPYRPGNPYGDVRRAWEPARLQQLIALALLAQRENDDVQAKAVHLLEEQFLSWVAANPPLRGIHAISVMECALRLLAVCYALDLVRHALHRPAAVWSACVSLMRGHAELIAKRVSRFSSRGNHTVAEATALIHVGLLFPELPEAAQWSRLGFSLLEEEADRQILPDGGGVEQALAYHRQVVDLYGLVVGLLECRGYPVMSVIGNAYRRGRAYLDAFADSHGHLPQIGDGDSGCALSSQVAHRPAPPVSRLGLTSFFFSGYSLLRSQSLDENLLILDHGPLGMPPTFGHGHADALSIVFRFKGQEILTDPGTFAYGPSVAWRNYFRGTRAHNTVEVDGLDQAEPVTPFQWQRPYHARLIRREELTDGRLRILAHHNAYLERTGVAHWRGVSVHPAGAWVIWDRLTGPGLHRLDLHWHCGVEPVTEADGFAFTIGQERLVLSMLGGNTRALRGETDPICGWRSTVYGQKEPSPTLRTSYVGMLPHEFVTMLRLDGASVEPEWREAELAIFEEWAHDAAKD